MADDEKIEKIEPLEPLNKESPRQKNQALPGHSSGDHRKAVRRGDPFANKNSLVKWSAR